MSTATAVQPGGGGLGVLRSKPTTSSNRPANRRITTSPIVPLEPVIMTIPLSVLIPVSVFMAVSPVRTFDSDNVYNLGRGHLSAQQRFTCPVNKCSCRYSLQPAKSPDLNCGDHYVGFQC